MSNQLDSAMMYKLITLASTTLSLLSNVSPAENNYNANLSDGPVRNTIGRSEILKNQLNIFRVVAIGDKNPKAFISVSDIYNDTSAIPSTYVNNQKNISFDKLKYFELQAAYRKKLLKGTFIKETDTVFMYDYKLNQLTKTPVVQLKAVAHLTPYVDKGEQITIWDYMVGFEVGDKLLKKSASNYYENLLVYIGSNNPFLPGKMQLVKWKEINKKQFPISNHNTLSKGDKEAYYNFTGGSIIYYIKDILTDGTITERYFIAISTKGKVVLKNEKFTNSEGSSIAPLNFVAGNKEENQWAGYLFKNKPAVILGFEYHSFGCPSIILLNKASGNIAINCDNRH